MPEGLGKQHQELADLVAKYVRERGSSTLRGKAFDITSRTGLRDYAEWFAGEVIALNEFQFEVEQAEDDE